MCAGGHRAGYLLGDDVALVGQGKPCFPQRLSELADCRRRPNHDAAALTVDMADPWETPQVEKQPVRCNYRRERVPGAGDPHLEAPGGSARDQ